MVLHAHHPYSSPSPNGEGFRMRDSKPKNINILKVAAFCVICLPEHGMRRQVDNLNFRFALLAEARIA